MEIPRRSGLASFLAAAARASSQFGLQVTGRTFNEQEDWSWALASDDLTPAGGWPGGGLKNNWRVEGDLFDPLKYACRVGYRINSQGMVSLRGMVELDAGAPPADVVKTIFTIEPDYRPAFIERHSVYLLNQTGNPKLMLLEINSNGNVSLISGTSNGAADPTGVTRLWLWGRTWWVAGVE